MDVPAVDLCISYLLRHHLIDEAVRIHEDHSNALKSRSLEAVYASSDAVATRKILLDAHKRLPRVTGLTNRCVNLVFCCSLILIVLRF